MEEFIGIVKLFAGTFAPRGWAFCQGQLLPISANSALFSILGTTYGGDGRTTFALPDLRGRVAVGMGQGPGLSDYREGQMGGAETTNLTENNMPSHTHTAKLQVSSANATESQATSGASIGAPGYPDGRKFTNTSGFNTSSPDVGLNSESVVVGSSGGNQPVENIQPYLAMNYIICLEGIFPPRN